MAISKNFKSPTQIVTNGDMSAASITSLVSEILLLDNVALQFTFTGSPVGTFDLQGSLDYTPGIGGTIINAGTWSSVTLSPAPIAAGSAGDVLLNLQQLTFPYFRVVYTKTSGTGTLQIWYSAKGL